MAILTQLVERRGPLVTVAVSPDEKVAAKRRAARLPAITPHYCEALVDTGSSACLIGPEIVAALGLESTGMTALGTASTAGERRPSRLFSVAITWTVGGRSMSMTVEAVESDLSDIGVGALLGRDFLARCLLVYNGPSGEFTLSF